MLTRKRPRLANWNVLIRLLERKWKLLSFQQIILIRILTFYAGPENVHILLTSSSDMTEKLKAKSTWKIRKQSLLCVFSANLCKMILPLPKGNPYASSVAHIAHMLTRTHTFDNATSRLKPFKSSSSTFALINYWGKLAGLANKSSHSCWGSNLLACSYIRNLALIKLFVFVVSKQNLLVTLIRFRSKKTWGKKQISARIWFLLRIIFPSYWNLGVSGFFSENLEAARKSFE